MSEEKPFYCKSCLSKFTRKHHLNRHLHIHSKLTKFEINEHLKKFNNIKDVYVKKKKVSVNIKHTNFTDLEFPIYTPNPNLVFPIPGLDYLSD